MRDVTLTSSRWLRTLALGVIVIGSGVLAVQLHRNGHTQGDDFALYLRQARSIFDGDIGAVIADNRFAVLNSDPAFSPLMYPWVWPLLLSPFVNLWGLDFDRLKLIEVAVFMAWLVLLHGIVRRRIGRLAALAIVAVIGTAPLYLAYTDQLLTELPHLAAVAVVIWWYDRVRMRSTLLSATRSDLVVLGALVTLTFNVRREGIALLAVIAVMQLYDVVASTERPRSLASMAATIRTGWQTLITPYLSFAITATLFQLLLPTALLPDNGNSSKFIDDRLGEYPGILADQLGFGRCEIVRGGERRRSDSLSGFRISEDQGNDRIFRGVAHGRFSEHSEEQRKGPLARRARHRHQALTIRRSALAPDALPEDLLHDRVVPRILRSNSIGPE